MREGGRERGEGAESECKSKKAMQSKAEQNKAQLRRRQQRWLQRSKARPSRTKQTISEADQKKVKQHPTAATAAAAAAAAKQWSDWSLNVNEGKVNQSNAQFCKAKQIKASNLSEYDLNPS